jgi:hypothetical protein
MLAIGGVAGTDVRLCDAVLESYPPQCGEPSISVVNLHPADIAGMQSSGNVFWAEGVRVAGVVTEGVLTVETIELNVVGNGLSLRLEIQGELRRGPVAWVVHLTNVAGEEIDLVFPSGQQADVALFDGDGLESYRWSNGRAFTEAIVDVTLPPSESARFVLEDQLEVPAGQYRIEVTLAASPSPGAAGGEVTVR